MKPRTTVNRCPTVHIFSLVDTLFTGRFLLGILTDISKWYKDEHLYMQENRTKSGGNTVWLPGMQLRFSATRGTVAQEDLISWNDYKQVVRKWHRKLGKVSFPPSLLVDVD